MSSLASLPPPLPTRRIGFLLAPQFSMIAFTAAVEPLRLANRVSGRELYAWRLFSADGGPVRASNGVEITVDAAFAEAQKLDAAVVCAGIDVQILDHRRLIATLRRLSSFGSAIGAVCTGAYVLAQAGLLDGHRATIHWENHAGLLTAFPDLDLSQELFEIDRNRFTCAGGTAAVDMMLSVIARDHGPAIAAQVTDQLIHGRIREAGERQRLDLRASSNACSPAISAARPPAITSSCGWSGRAISCGRRAWPCCPSAFPAASPRPRTSPRATASISAAPRARSAGEERSRRIQPKAHAPPERRVRAARRRPDLKTPSSCAPPPGPACRRRWSRPGARSRTPLGWPSATSPPPSPAPSSRAGSSP